MSSSICLSFKKDSVRYRYFQQGCESGSAWICIHFTSWIRIQEGKFFKYKQKKGKEIANNCNVIQFIKKTCTKSIVSYFRAIFFMYFTKLF